MTLQPSRQSGGAGGTAVRGRRSVSQTHGGCSELQICPGLYLSRPIERHFFCLFFCLFFISPLILLLWTLSLPSPDAHTKAHTVSRLPYISHCAQHPRLLSPSNPSASRGLSPNWQTWDIRPCFSFPTASSHIGRCDSPSHLCGRSFESSQVCDIIGPRIRLKKMLVSKLINLRTS